MSITLSSVLSFVTLLLVIVPLLFTDPFATQSACLFIIPDKRKPLGDILYGSFGICSGPSFELASISMIIDLPASSAFSISVSKARKKGSLFSSSKFSWGPYPLIILIDFSVVSTSTTRISNSSLYSAINFGLRSSCAATKVPPPFFVLIASNTTKLGISIFPFFLAWVSCTVTTLDFVHMISDLRLSLFPFITLAAFVENSFRYPAQCLFMCFLFLPPLLIFLPRGKQPCLALVWLASIIELSDTSTEMSTLWIIFSLYTFNISFSVVNIFTWIGLSFNA